MFFTISKHASIRMKERNINISMVMDIIKYGKCKEKSNEVIVYHSDKYRVVVNNIKKIIITVTKKSIFSK